MAQQVTDSYSLQSGYGPEGDFGSIGLSWTDQLKSENRPVLKAIVERIGSLNPSELFKPEFGLDQNMDAAIGRLGGINFVMTNEDITSADILTPANVRILEMMHDETPIDQIPLNDEVIAGELIAIKIVSDTAAHLDSEDFATKAKKALENERRTVPAYNGQDGVSILAINDSQRLPISQRLAA